MTMIKVIISQSNNDKNYHVTKMNYGKYQNIASPYFYINNVIMQFSYLLHPRLIQDRDHVWVKRK